MVGFPNRRQFGRMIKLAARVGMGTYGTPIKEKIWRSVCIGRIPDLYCQKAIC